MEEINGEDRLGVSIVEDYSLDREDPNKYSVFVLEKHFVLISRLRRLTLGEKTGLKGFCRNLPLCFHGFGRGHNP